MWPTPQNARDGPENVASRPALGRPIVEDSSEPRHALEQLTYLWISGVVVIVGPFQNEHEQNSDLW